MRKGQLGASKAEPAPSIRGLVLYWTYLSLSWAQGTTGKEKLFKKTLAEFKGVNDELLFISWKETYSGTILKGSRSIWPPASEQPISSFKKTTMKLHRKWDCHEQPLEISVYSHYCMGKSLHPHIITCNRQGRERKKKTTLKTGLGVTSRNVENICWFKLFPSSLPDHGKQT